MLRNAISTLPRLSRLSWHRTHRNASRHLGPVIRGRPTPCKPSLPRPTGASRQRAVLPASMLRGLFDGQRQFGNGLFAHDEFLDLSGHRHRKAVDEFDMARDLVMRDLAFAEIADFLGSRGLAI